MNANILLQPHSFVAGGGFGGGLGFTLDGGGLTLACSRRPPLGGRGGGGLDPFLTFGLLISIPLLFQ